MTSTGEEPIIVTTTGRLLLRRFRPEDLAVLTALNADREVMRYITGRPTPLRTSATGSCRSTSATTSGSVAWVDRWRRSG